MIELKLMDEIIKAVVEKVTNLKNNTDEVIFVMDIKSKLDETMKTAIRLKLKELFTKDSVYFITNSNNLIVDWSLNPRRK
jgi:hypothetical protein